MIVVVGQPICDLDIEHERLGTPLHKLEKVILNGMEAFNRQDIPCPAPSMVTVHEYVGRFPVAGIPGRTALEAEALAQYGLAGTLTRIGT